MRKSSAVAAVWCGLGLAGVAGAVPVSTIRLTVMGGGHPGTWQVREARALCADGYIRPGEWSARYAVPALGPRALTSLQLFVPDGRNAANGTRQLSLSVTFGPIARPASGYDVETRLASRKRQGTGVATVTDRDATASMTFEATTADGVALHGVIECGFVDRAPTP